MSNTTLHNEIIVNYTVVYRIYVFCDLAKAAKTKIVSTLVIMDPAMKPQYCAGQHPTSIFFPQAVESALYSQEQILKESTS